MFVFVRVRERGGVSGFRRWIMDGSDYGSRGKQDVKREKGKRKWRGREDSESIYIEGALVTSQ